jgi:hypothetical protein
MEEGEEKNDMAAAEHLDTYKWSAALGPYHVGDMEAVGGDNTHASVARSSSTRPTSGFFFFAFSTGIGCMAMAECSAK